MAQTPACLGGVWGVRARGCVRKRGLLCQLTGLGAELWAPFPDLNSPFLLPPQGRKESSPKLEEAGRVGSLEPGTLKKLVSHLVPAHRRGDPFFVPAFLAAYRRFATPRQVLDLLLLRCAPAPSPGTHRLRGGSRGCPAPLCAPVYSVKHGVL